MNVRIDPSWNRVLSGEWEAPYFKQLTDFVRQEYRTHQVFPPGGQIFAAFDAAPFDRVKVVILGQDPYHGVGQANGLCFSVNEGVALPPSLMNIFKEVHDDVGAPIPSSGDLSRWARQGVLLLNATLRSRPTSRCLIRARVGRCSPTMSSLIWLRSGSTWCSCCGGHMPSARGRLSTAAATWCSRRLTRLPCRPTVGASSARTISLAPTIISCSMA